MGPSSAESLRIHHVVSDIHRKDAGPSYAVSRLVEALGSYSPETHLHALEPRPKDEPSIDVTYYRRFRFTPSLGISGEMRRGLKLVARQADVMHIHGLWMMPNVYPGWAVKGTDCVLAMSPHGMLEPWALEWSNAKKRVFGAAFQRRVLDRVQLFHATSEHEADSIRAAGLSAPIVVVPIGVDIPATISPRKEAARPKVLLYLGRIHPVKNLPSLIEAWDATARNHPEWTLIISGPGKAAHLAEIDRLVRKTDRAKFRGPAYGAEKTELFFAADLLILPSHSENFGVVVAEALAHGTPVISTTGTPWQGLETHGCGWWTEPSSESIARALDSALALDAADLAKMGERGRNWMKRDFAWDSVGRKMNHAYEWIRFGEHKPPHVRTS